MSGSGAPSLNLYPETENKKTQSQYTFVTVKHRGQTLGPFRAGHWHWHVGPGLSCQRHDGETLRCIISAQSVSGRYSVDKDARIGSRRWFRVFASRSRSRHVKTCQRWRSELVAGASSVGGDEETHTDKARGKQSDDHVLAFGFAAREWNKVGGQTGASAGT
eukprot:2753249-Rhodomonas_salina.1